MIIKSTNVYMNDHFQKAAIEIKDNKILHILPYETVADEDYEDNRIVPGFYDVHSHGYHGYDSNLAEKQGLKTWLKALVKEGVCGILPTTATDNKENYLSALKNIADVQKENPEGAKILGIHFEGPYISSDYKGAQNQENIVVPRIEEFKEYEEASNHLIQIVTLASECDPNHEFIRYLASKNIHASLGHSNATYNEVLEAIKDGADSFTHVFNAMSGFNHRSGGLVNAALALDFVWGEIICDTIHVSPEVLNIFFKCKKDKAMVISDSLLCKGFEVGSKFDFAGQEVEIYEDGSAHLTTGKKNLAGSTLKINEGLKNLVEYANVPISEALNACSKNPANYLGLGDHKGQIKEGYDADIVVLNTEYQVLQTYIEGQKQC